MYLILILKWKINFLWIGRTYLTIYVDYKIQYA